MSKQKAELKHTLEMQTLEQGELEGLRGQHQQRLGELERTQRALQEVRFRALQELGLCMRSDLGHLGGHFDRDDFLPLHLFLFNE